MNAEGGEMTDNKVSRKVEDAYFARMEFERKQKIIQEEQKKLEKMMRKELKELHHMHCPKCGMKLIEIDFKGVKIDKCSECGGIYLDDGELDQLMKPENKGVLTKLFKAFKD
jgi:uncharacterized protein